MGIDKTLEVIQDVGNIAVNVIGLVKRGGIGIGGFGKVLAILADAKELFDDATAALPELTDVDGVEAGRMATAAYAQVKRIVEAVAA